VLSTLIYFLSLYPEIEFNYMPVCLVMKLNIFFNQFVYLTIKGSELFVFTTFRSGVFKDNQFAGWVI